MLLEFFFCHIWGSIKGRSLCNLSLIQVLACLELRSVFALVPQIPSMDWRSLLDERQHSMVLNNSLHCRLSETIDCIRLLLLRLLLHQRTVVTIRHNTFLKVNERKNCWLFSNQTAVLSSKCQMLLGHVTEVTNHSRC